MLTNFRQCKRLCFDGLVVTGIALLFGCPAAPPDGGDAANQPPVAILGDDIQVIAGDSVTFDPGEVDALEGVGNIYRKMRVTDNWGVLDVTDGGLITEDWRAAVVPAPDGTEGTTIVGDGYTLTLAPGWVVAHGEGGFYVERETP